MFAENFVFVYHLADCLEHLLGLRIFWVIVIQLFSFQYLNMMLSKSNGYSMIPVVGARARSTSCSVGR